MKATCEQTARETTAAEKPKPQPAWPGVCKKFLQKKKEKKKRNLRREWRWWFPPLIKPRRWWSLRLWLEIWWSRRCSKSHGGTDARRSTRWSGTASQLIWKERRDNGMRSPAAIRFSSDCSQLRWNTFSLVQILQSSRVNYCRKPSQEHSRTRECLPQTGFPGPEKLRADRKAAMVKL